MTADRIEDEGVVMPRRLALGEQLEPPEEERTNRFPPVAWWLNLDPPERVLYRGLVLLAVGLWFVYPPLAAIVPGAAIASTALFTILLIAWRAND